MVFRRRLFFAVSGVALLVVAAALMRAGVSPIIWAVCLALCLRTLVDALGPVGFGGLPTAVLLIANAVLFVVPSIPDAAPIIKGVLLLDICYISLSHAPWFQQRRAQQSEFSGPGVAPEHAEGSQSSDSGASSLHVKSLFAEP